ncbi:MAG TPA: hypothetical protein ENJ28_03095 [Gammaproteobacteria bacterium]|nr:hypothetical protein [Gammaproteobacteria bacterium]
MRRLSVFFGYQFNGTRIGRIDRESAYTEALDNVNSELESTNGISLSWDYWGLANNEYIGDQILSLLDRSDILIFDLSENNLNVFIELGYSMALSRARNKKVLIVVHENVEISQIGSDLSGKFVLRVNESNIIPKLSKQIRDAAKEYCANNSIGFVRDFWGITEGKQFHIICPEIPVELRTQFANSEETNYLRYSKFADIDSLIYVKTHLYSVDSTLVITDYTSEEYNHSVNEAQIVVGGPAWNRIAREYQKILPVKFEDGGDGCDDPLVVKYGDNVDKLIPVVENNQLIHDISCFARLSVGSKKKVYLVSGCRTLGVLGSATVFLSSECAGNNIEWLSSIVGDSDFVVVFRTQPFYGTVSPAILSRENVEFLFVAGQHNVFEKAL